MHIYAGLVSSSRLGKVRVYSLTALFSLFVQIVFTWLQSLCTCKKKKKHNKNYTETTTNFVALPNHILLMDIFVILVCTSPSGVTNY